MTVTLTRDDFGQTLLNSNIAYGSWASGVFVMTGTTADWLFSYATTNVMPGQLISQAIMCVGVPAGYPGGTYHLALGFRNAAGGILAYSPSGPATVIPTGSTGVNLVLSGPIVAPPLTASVELIVNSSIAGVTGRRVNVPANVFTSSANPLEIISASLERDLRRQVSEPPNTAEALITSSAKPGLMAGQITYLCDTLVDALAVDALYSSHPLSSVVLSTGSGAALDGLRHKAVEKVRLSAERAQPGHAAKWLATVTLRERLS